MAKMTGNNIWTMTEAKSRFIELVERASTDGVQIITRYGKPCIAVISIDEYERQNYSGDNLTQFLPDNKSALDVPGVDTGVTRQEILDSVREGHEQDVSERRASYKSEEEGNQTNPETEESQSSITKKAIEDAKSHHDLKSFDDTDSLFEDLEN